MSREELPFKVIQTWKPEQLKEFCRKRALKVSGPKAELAARVFAAAEMGIAINCSGTNCYYRKREGIIAYNAKWNLSSRSFDTEGWVGEGKREHDLLAADIPE